MRLKERHWYVTYKFWLNHVIQLKLGATKVDSILGYYDKQYTIRHDLIFGHHILFWSMFKVQPILHNLAWFFFMYGINWHTHQVSIWIINAFYNNSISYKTKNRLNALPHHLREINYHRTIEDRVKVSLKSKEDNFSIYFIVPIM